jgi:hypothetical protein
MVCSDILLNRNYVKHLYWGDTERRVFNENCGQKIVRKARGYCLELEDVDRGMKIKII